MWILQNVSVKMRIHLLVIILLMLIVGIGGFTLIRFIEVKDNFTQYSQEAVPGQVLILKISRDTNYVSRLTRSIMLGDNYAKNHGRLVERIADIKQHYIELAPIVAGWNDPVVANQLVTLVAEAKEASMAFFNASLDLMNRLSSNSSSEDRANAWAVYKSEFSPMAQASRKTFKALSGLIEDQKQSIFENSSNIVNSSVTISMIATGVAVVLGLTLGFFISHSIVAPVTLLQQVIERIEQSSDLTVRLNAQSKDELGVVSQAVDNLLYSFHETLLKIVQAAAQLSDSSTALAHNSATTSEFVSNQLTETEMVATAMNQMAATAVEVSQNAAATATGAQNASEQAQTGQEVVQATIDSIGTLANEIQMAADTIDKVSDDSQEIGRVLDVIRGIAEQTNLLALNAAIEAARAGEQGRGFAVVADEVRSLASRTESSTQEIQQMIERLQQGTTSAVEVMQRSRTHADSSVDRASQAGESLQQITSAVSEINDMAAQIACAAEEQTSVNDEINKNISNISLIANQTASESEKTSIASESLSELASHLEQQVAQFKV